MRHLALVVLALPVVPALPQARQAQSGRIDIYVVDQAFDLSQARGSRGARVTACSWLGEGKELTGVVVSGLGISKLLCEVAGGLGIQIPSQLSVVADQAAEANATYDTSGNFIQ